MEDLGEGLITFLLNWYYGSGYARLEPVLSTGLQIFILILKLQE